MRKIAFPFFLAFILLAATLSLIQTARGQETGDPEILSSETQGENRREIQGDSRVEEPQQPSIGFIDSPSPTCYQPDPARDDCYLSWYYFAVDSNPNYMITMTLELNNIGQVARTQGFFQTSMYVPYDMLANGFKLACGSLGAGGNPKLGNAYPYTIRARDSAGLKSANYGTAYCPAFQP